MKQVITFDFHSHILPGADHGASTVEESLKLLGLAKKSGLETVVGTPHFYPHRHRVEDFLARRNHAYDKLKPYFDSDEIPKVLKGAEILICPNIDKMEGFRKLAVENTETFLLELPFVFEEHTDELFDTVERMVEELGYTVFMAHPNRYPTQSVMRMVDIGAKLQLNMEDMMSLREKKRAKDWLDRGYVYAVGSDVHHNPAMYKKFGKGAKFVGAYLDRINHPIEGI